MGIFLNPEDLTPLAPGLAPEKAALFIEDVESNALIEAPCIAEPDFAAKVPGGTEIVKSVLRQAVLRWHRAGEGGLSSLQRSTGPFLETQSFDTRVFGEGRLLSSEIRRLKHLCRRYNGTGSRRKAFTVIPRG